MIAPAFPRPMEVLVVDDEPHFLWMMQFALELAGYRVHTAESGPAALERLQGEAAHAALALFDPTLPGMDGEELYRQMQTIAPGLSVVICARPESHGRDVPWIAEHDLRTVGKPFDRRTLLRTVLEVLAERSIQRPAVGGERLCRN